MSAPDARSTERRHAATSVARAAVDLRSATEPSPRARRAAARLLGRHHWCTPWLARVLAADDRVLVHVLEQPDSYVHYLCLVEIGTSVARAEATSPAALAEWLRARPKKRVLDAIFRPAPTGIVAVLDRLPSRALARRQYETLLELLRDPAAAKLLRHARVVRGCLIEALADLPSALRGAPVLARASSKSTLDRVRYELLLATAVCPPERRGELARSLRRVRSLDDVEAWGERWKEKAPFPPPPVDAVRGLRPIGNAAELASVARAFGNCLRECREDILRGIRYFYVSDDRNRVVAMLVKHAYLGWVLDSGSIRGPGNRTVPRRTREAIEGAFRERGIEALPGEFEDDRLRWL